MFTFTDPYEDADKKAAAEEEAKLLKPEPPKKHRKAMMAGLMAFGLVMAVIILANVAGFFGSHVAAANTQPDAPKPKTMGKRDAESFAQQQAGEADYMKGVDKDKAQQKTEDTVLGQGRDLAANAGADPYDEDPHAPKKTQAQDDAEHGRTPAQRPKTEAEALRERAALEKAHREQNDLDSSPVSVDFADYFDKDKPRQTAAVQALPGLDAKDRAAEEQATEEIAENRARRSQEMQARNEGEEEPHIVTTHKRDPAHDPAQDYEFDSSYGKQYRLMEDTIIETVLVNRLAGAAVGPVICMVTTDVYSQSGVHLLIPKGTRLLGNVSAVGSTGQERLFVSFHRAIMPDGYSVSLDKFKGLDVVGRTGLRDLVNHHYVQIFGTSIALAAISAAVQVGNTTSALTYNWTSSERSGVSQGLGQASQRVLERYLGILPTFTIRERARVKVMLSNDLLLPDVKNHTMDPDL